MRYFCLCKIFLHTCSSNRGIQYISNVYSGTYSNQEVCLKKLLQTLTESRMQHTAFRLSVAQ